MTTKRLLRVGVAGSAAAWVLLGGVRPNVANAAPTTGQVVAEEEASSDGESAAGEGQAAVVPTESELAEARVFFSNGVTLLEKAPPNYQDAYRQFLLAYEKSGHNWKVLGNLGLCALSLERDGEALRYYRDYLDQGGAEVSAEEREAIEGELLLIRGNMATVKLVTALPGTRVSVIRKGSSVPAQLYDLAAGELELGLRAGELRLFAKAGDKEEQWEVVIGPEEEVSHSFSFVPPPPPASPVAAAAPLPEAPQAAPREARPVRTVGFVTAGVGVASIVGGAVLGAISQSQEKQAKADGCSGSVCLESVQGELNAAADLALIANVLMIGGGVLTASGVTLVVVGSKSKKERSGASLEILPRLGSSYAGLAAVGSF